MRATLIHGDSADVLREMADNSVDSIVTDPPAGIGFMGRDWDGDRGGRTEWVTWLTGIMREALRVLKPGGHALVWALPRTSHWTATAIEDAGFEIRDRHHHITALDERTAEFLSSLDKAQREMLSRLIALQESPVLLQAFGSGFPKSLTPKSARIPDGTGTALKPAVEHWILARKPLEGTVAENLAAHGTGVLAIEACRIGGQDTGAPAGRRRHGGGVETGVTWQLPDVRPESPAGRWPAHLSLAHADGCREIEHAMFDCVEGCPVRVLDEQSGERTSGRKFGGQYARGSGIHEGGQRADDTACYADTGGASRFFYIAKPSRSERDRGLDDLPAASGGEATGRKDDSAGTRNPRAGAGRTGGAKNIHPTVKSIALMRWLVRLITPPGGTVLDMFAGSGSTGLACHAEGMHSIGIERDAKYHKIAYHRLRKVYGRAETTLPEQRALDALLTPRRPVTGGGT